MSDNAGPSPYKIQISWGFKRKISTKLWLSSPSSEIHFPFPAWLQGDFSGQNLSCAYINFRRADFPRLHFMLQAEDWSVVTKPLIYFLLFASRCPRYTRFWNSNKLIFEVFQTTSPSSKDCTEQFHKVLQTTLIVSIFPGIIYQRHH